MIAPFYRMLEFILYPLVSFIEKISIWLVSMIVGRIKKRSFLVKREEILALIKEIEREGVLEKGEKEAIEDVFDFGETKLKDVCIPLKKVYLEITKLLPPLNTRFKL